MKCKLNPSIIRFLYKAFLWVTLLLIAVVVMSVGMYGLAFVVGTTVQAVDSNWLIELLIDDAHVYTDPMDFWTSVGNMLIWLTMIHLLVIGFILTIIHSAYTETKETLHQRKHDLQYRFETTKVPWYRVLLSYIIVCEKTKDL